MCFITNSWIVIWILLEINTLSFCSIIKTLSKQKKSLTEMRIKYFIIQSVSSSLLLFSALIIKEKENLLIPILTLIVISLIVKIASAPFQQWFVEIVKFSKWKNRTILITWQKLAPCYLVIYQIKAIVLPFIIFSAWVGRILQLNKTNIIEIIALSSVFNIRWIIFAIVVNTKIFLLFRSIYWISVWLSIKIIQDFSIKKISREPTQSNRRWYYFVVMINLAGIPPLAGFLAKWITFSEGVKITSMLTITVLLVISSINLFIYLRAINLISTKNTTKRQKEVKQSKKKLIITIIVANVFPIVIIAI